MAKYTKHNSNYIRTERHQHLNDSSSIFERDWVTIGSQLSFGPGKRIVYNDGNFIFTRSTSPFYFKKYKTSVDVGTWTYDDVKDATSQINQINSDEYSEDIRTYAYYGSCVELVRSSIENIINWFPGNIKVSNSQPEETAETNYLLLDNPFEINLYVKDINLTKYDNIMRYLSFSWENYVLKNDEKITKYNSTTRSLYEKNENNTKTFQMFSNEEYYDLEDREDWVKSRCHLMEWLPGDGRNSVYEVKLNDNVTISGWILNDTLLDFVETDTEFTLTPSKEVIEDYFNNLHGFEKQLLNRKNKPIYTNTFVTPIEYNLGYVFYKRTYTWPSNDYCIDISSVMYIEFLNNLTNMAELYDELCTDNVWRKMTHEAIKNYDWTYTKEYADGDEEENIEGGERMHKVLNIIARVFDDVKRNIDLVKKNNRITYNGDRNMPNALLSDKLELYGWNVYSTIPTYKMLEDSETQTFKELPANEIKIDDDFLSEYNIRWYDTKNNNEITFADVDVEFMRKLVLSSKRIFETKGTNHSIDMIMAMFGYGRQGENPDYEINETYHTTIPREYDEHITYFNINGQHISINTEDFVNDLNDLLGITENGITPDTLDEVLTNANIDGIKIEFNINGQQYLAIIEDVAVLLAKYIIPSSDLISLLNNNIFINETNIVNLLHVVTKNTTSIRFNMQTEINGRQSVISIDRPLQSFVASLNNFLGTDDRITTLNVINVLHSATFGELDLSHKYISFEIEEQGSEVQRAIKKPTQDVIDFFNRTFFLNEGNIWEFFNYLVLSSRTTPSGETVVVPYEEQRVGVSEDIANSILNKIFGGVPVGNAIVNVFHTSHTFIFGDRIVSMNMEKQKTKLYNDDVSGIPVNKFTIEKETDNESEIELKTYLIPYYDSERVYDGDFIFQSKGGWFYDKKSDDEDSYWTETVSYLHVVPTVGDLLNINPTTTNEGDIFYVSNVNDYVNYIEFDDSGSLYSNFFVLEDLYNIESIYAWTNLDLTGEIYHLPVDPEADDYEEGYTEEDIEKYKKYVKKANYLNNLIPYNIGNNPHVGYGYYDNGNEYLEYMHKPFKYSIDNHLLSYESEQDAENITFEISDPILTDKLNEKVKIFANSINVSDIITYGGKRNLVYKGYDEASIKEMMKTTYYLNSKVIYMKNNLENDNYKNYFKNVIIKYLMQIIPSTAILILEDF